MTYVRAIVPVILLLALSLGAAWMYRLGGEHARAECAKRERDQIAKQLDDIQKSQAEDKKRAERLQKTIDALPKSEGAMREIVRNNPAPCDMPKPVADGLRGAIDSANRARAVPADS